MVGEDLGAVFVALKIVLEVLKGMDNGE